MEEEEDRLMESISGAWLGGQQTFLLDLVNHRRRAANRDIFIIQDSEMAAKNKIKALSRVLHIS